MIQYLRHYTEIDGQRSLQIVAVDEVPGVIAADSLRARVTGTLVDVHGRRPTVYAMHVSPAWRGQGIGAEILRRLINALIMERVGNRPKHVYTIARVGNVDAIRFYERHGFVVREPNDDQHKRLILTKVLG